MTTATPTRIPPDDGRFTFTYSPDPGRCAGCGNTVEHAHLEVDEQHYCATCLGRSPFYRQYCGNLLAAANLWCAHLAEAPDGQRPGHLADMQRLLHGIGDDLVPEGTGEPLPEPVFIGELLDRARAADLGDTETLTLVGRLFPGLTGKQLTDILERRQQAAAIHLARLQAEDTLGDCAMIVISRAAGPTLGEACDQLGIDLDRFVHVATAKAAEHGVAVRDLDLGVVDECLAASRDDRPASLRRAIRDHERYCARHGLNPTDPEVFGRYLDRLPEDAKAYCARKEIQRCIDAAFQQAVAAGHAVDLGGGSYETVAGHEEAVKELLDRSLFGDLDEDQPEDDAA